jgi:hypothetical protein
MAGREHPVLTREELLAAFDAGWMQFLPRLARLSADERAAYVAVQGYASLKDLLAHLCGWFQEGMQVVTEILNGQDSPRQYNIDAFNVISITYYQDYSPAAVETDFSRLAAAQRAQIAQAPARAFYNRRAYNWFYVNAVEHYDEHRLPGAPALHPSVPGPNPS